MNKNELLAKYGTLTKAAEALGIHRRTLTDQLKKDESECKEGFEFSDNVISCKSYSIKSVEDALKHGNVNTDIWMVDKYTINSWEVAAKTGKPKKLETRTLWQIKVWLKRILPEYVESTLNNVLKEFKKQSIKVRRSKKQSAKHLLELSLSDCHFGKIGEGFDTKSTSQLFTDSVNELLDRVSGFDVEEILLPLGNDFFHVDNWDNTTTKGTLMEADGEFTNVFELACKTVKGVINRALLTAPIKVVYVPGNHDRQTSWYLCKVLEAWFYNNTNVEIDCNSDYRKYMQYGVNLLGYTHGNEEKHADLPMIMANEVPELWAKTKYRTWRLGHFHRKKQTNYVSHIENGGVLLTILPSLSGSDNWHKKKGYIGNSRSAECHLWHKENGPTGTFVI